jgi:hypothetical protein
MKSTEKTKLITATNTKTASVTDNQPVIETSESINIEPKRSIVDTAILEVVEVVEPELPESGNTRTEIDKKPDQPIPRSKPKSPTKAEKAKVIYDEMIKDLDKDRATIIAKIKKELLLTKAGASTYFYRFQRESGVVKIKGTSKVEKAKVIYDQMILEGRGRKEIIDAFVAEVDLTPAGASTYYQNIKKAAEQSISSR